MSSCFICDKSLSEGTVVTVHERGVQTLLLASIKRGEKQHELLLRDSKTISVHKACQKKYADERTTAAVARRRLLQPTSSQSPTPSQPPDVDEFDFANKCFICTETIPIDFEAQNKKKPVHLRNRVHSVQKFSIVKNTILKWLENRNDESAQKIAKRIEDVSDADGAGAKYHNNCMTGLKNPLPTGRKRSLSRVDDAMESVYAFISATDECQFKLSELVNLIDADKQPDLRTMKTRLLEKYGEDICIFDCKGHDAFVCLKNRGYKILSSTWYEEKKSNKEEERLRVVREAAAILLEDIRSQCYDIETYPASDDFMKDVDSAVPKSLRLLLTEMITKSKRNSSDHWKKKCTSIAHAIIAAVRPRSFFSPLQVGVGAFMYKKYGSRHLIDVLSNLGFCATYKEVSLFESSCIQRQRPQILPHAFSQFVFDNADFNVNTLDGKGTFHAMGGIHCVTPFNAINRDQPIARLAKQTKSSVELGNFGTVSLTPYEKPNATSAQALLAANMDCLRPISHNILPTMCDFMWLYAKWSFAQNIAGWNGFMEEATTGRSFAKSKILCMPFIDAPPSDHDTIYTALLLAVEQCKTVNQEACIVTFDLPLFMKAHDIIHTADPTSPVKNVIVRLGGFHLLMSFLGSIGYIMAGSGLADLFQSIYATNSVDKIMSGHAYSRAVRAHILTHLALAKKIMDGIEFTDEERDEMDFLINNPERSSIFTAAENIVIQAACNKFDEELKKIANRGPTAKIWLEYFRMVTLVKHFIEAERSGNWNIHLDTIQKMLPYFHASGHFNYAKAAHIYLQDMADLGNKMPEDEFRRFTTNGYFTIRRTNKFWSGIMSDMTIEQTLMRSMKTSGGLTQGRGITHSTLSRWTMGMVFMQNVSEEVENFCGVFSATTEQHVDSRSSRITRDNTDVEKLDNWLTEHSPFLEGTELQSISTGVVGNASINCYRCSEIGAEMVNRMVGRDLYSYKFKRSDKVLPLATVTSSIKINSVPVPIDPLLLFQRMCISKETSEDLKKHVAYELAPYPLSLFTEAGMRHGTKSTLYKCFSSLPATTNLGSNRMVVVDGGFLLHRVVWDRNVSFLTVCQQYVRYVQNHFGVNTTIVFDGYPEDVADLGTKSSERLRRSKTQSSVDIIITEAMIATTNQEKFLANERNKNRFITMLKKELEQSGILVEQAREDADTLIVQTAIQMSSRYDSVIIVGEDVDLLVLLTGLARGYENIFFRKPGRGRTPEALYGPNCLDSRYSQSVRDNILFLHAFSGCDTTAAAYNIGKTKVLMTLQNNDSLRKAVELFAENNVDPNILANAGERFFIALYGGDESEESINSLRYKCFGKLASKTKLNLSFLPPTRDTARYHSFRVYHQVQTWLGFHHEPEEWGWKRTSSGLEPVRTKMAPAPSTLLQIISCKCTKSCGARCGCRRAGLKCSIICSNCSGETCDNVPDVFDAIANENDENEIEENEIEEDATLGDSSPLNMAEEEDINLQGDEGLPPSSKQIKLDS